MAWSFSWSSGQDVSQAGPAGSTNKAVHYMACRLVLVVVGRPQFLLT